MADHDQRFKTLLREFFAEFVRLFWPPWADRFDLAAVAWLEQEVFPDPPQGERRQLDLVGRLPVRTAADASQGASPPPWVVLVHVEVEGADTVQPLRGRMFEYHAHLRRRYGVPVLSVGLYLHVGLGGVGWDEYAETFWGERLVHFRYPYVGLPALDAFDYVARPNVLAAALAALMRVPGDRRAELKAEALRRAATAGANEHRRFLLAECIEAYLPLEAPHLGEYQRLLLTEPYQEARMLAQTSFEKGLEKGLEEGLEKGREEGLEIGRRSVLEGLLADRFGPLSDRVKERLAAFSGERLLELARALLHARSLRELGLED